MTFPAYRTILLKIKPMALAALTTGFAFLQKLFECEGTTAIRCEFMRAIKYQEQKTETIFKDMQKLYEKDEDEDEDEDKDKNEAGVFDRFKAVFVKGKPIRTDALKVSPGIIKVLCIMFAYGIRQLLRSL